VADDIMRGVLLTVVGALIVLAFIQLAGLSHRVFRGRAIERTRRQEIVYGLIALVMGVSGLGYALTWDPGAGPSGFAIAAQGLFLLGVTASLVMNFVVSRNRQPTRTVWVFNAPPGWPPAPAGWVPPQGWQLDPSWPAPPAGWQWWVRSPPVSTPAGARTAP
jgi:hypothetical protein